MNLDRENLSNEFDMDFRLDPSEALSVLENGDVDVNNPNKIMENNIIKANQVLDRLLEEMNTGNFSPRMAEVASYMIANINSAIEIINKKNTQNCDLLLKEKMLSLKEKETLVKLKILDKNTGVRNQNIIVTDRETILKMLKTDKTDKEVKKLIETKSEGENDE